MKKWVKVILGIVAVLLAIVICWGGLMFWHYPHYKEQKRVISAAEQSIDEVRVMSCNLRCISPTDLGKKSWFYRADLIIKNIENENPGIIGFQEATKWQYGYICDTLDGYDSIITYRDNAFNSEGCPIFYRTDMYTLIDKGSFWLSETPDEMSKDWNSACYRICSYVILKDNASDREFVVFNTHLDHISDEARIKGIGVVLDKIEQFGSLPSMIMGDFNAEEDSETYKSATENFLDVKYQTENTMTSCTYQNWGKALDRDCIDYLMISKIGFTVNSYKVVTDTYDGVYPSDHFPLSVSLTLS
ncbi:MAG: endonuclease/exonuclease/phosphatase family protein [Oscillospiraceae bacterium]|nr:endonuclease/exonuclease/phosphatase family protein [Oscillospiraceae bacterium]